MKELIAIQTDLKAPKSQTNTFGKYKYRSLEDILEALKPLLQKQNCFVSLTDEITLVGDRYYVKATATIRNDSGDSVSVSAMAREEENKKGMDSAQLTGATSSYARKYALNGLFAIDDTKDADATNTHGNEPQQKAPPPSKATDDDRKQLWNAFKARCGSIDPMLILEQDGIDMSDKAKVYATVRQYQSLSDEAFEGVLDNFR